MFLTENPPGLNAPKIHQSICLFQKHQYMLIYKCIHEQIQIQIWHMKVDKDSKFACTVNTNIYSECGHQSFFMCIYDETETRTEEIGLEKYLRLPKFSRESPCISNTLSRESPTFQTNFHVIERSPCHPKDLLGNRVDLEIQVF